MNDLNQQPHQPLSIGDWLVTLIVTAIPVIGFIMLFVWAFGGNAHPSKANWAKAALILFAIGIVLSVLLTVIFGVGMFALFNSQSEGAY